jgi:formate dehydrogenase subunit delta
MRQSDLARMSAQIAQFFEPYPEEDAVVGVAEHLTSFWDPVMRRELVAMQAAGTPALHPLVAKAVARLGGGGPV